MIVIDIFWIIVDFITEKLNLKIVIFLVVLILLVCLAT